MLLRCAQITIELHTVLHLLLQLLVSGIILLGNLTFYGRVLQSTALIRKAADEIRITIFFSNPSEQRNNELVVNSNKLTNNFAGLVTSGLGQDVARGPPVLPRLCSFKCACFVACISR
jgi:hypothetical protein